MFWTVRLCIFTTNDYALQPNWFSGDKNLGFSGTTGTYSLVRYADYGFPIRIDGSSTEGPYWLAWTINITTTVVAGIIIVIILHKMPPRNRKRV